ncbi:DUF6241 domain-containing protein [Halobacillus litoralis]|uniref:DUF6241 domain-containing protein n=1 Tax=Halobacillus litoralis TaxID=45668 RepID=UPI001CFCFA44|nr:DUF6241 domain-containing protein [Halobacillus litoralis]
MKKWMIITAITLIAVLGGGGTYYFLTQGEEELTEAEAKEITKSINEVVSEEQLEGYKKEGKNPFGDKDEQSSLTDGKYKDYIHFMSHQKVKADKKWGFIEIHPDRINWLLSGLDQVELRHEDVYKNILTKWQNGDFSTADNDHNQIWNLENGTVGKATGLLSITEEAEYIERTKNK